MTNEETNLGLSVRGKAKECYNSEDERLNDYASKLGVSVDQGQTGSTGEQGQQGQQGQKGDKGDKGDPGPKGDDGEPGTVMDDSGEAVFLNAATSVTISGKDVSRGFFSLFTIDDTVASHPQNLGTAINKVDFDGTDTIVTITVAAFNESPTIAPQSNLGLRWILFSQA